MQCTLAVHASTADACLINCERLLAEGVSYGIQVPTRWIDTCPKDATFSSGCASSKNTLAVLCAALTPNLAAHRSVYVH